MSDKLLEVKNLSVEYDTEISTVYAVNGLDLDLNYGETLGLVGEARRSPLSALPVPVRPPQP